jgi:hypothetical protein
MPSVQPREVVQGAHHILGPFGMSRVERVYDARDQGADEKSASTLFCSIGHRQPSLLQRGWVVGDTDVTWFVGNGVHHAAPKQASFTR